MRALKLNRLIEDFRQPGMRYRGAPFWSWNGKLDPDELRRQVRVLHRMGFGGFFMHSRVGLATPYLSDEWFRCVGASVDEARRLGMTAWIYDEDRWPSGAAGGLVTKNPKYRQRKLVMDVFDKPAQLKWTGDTLAAFTAMVTGARATQVQRLKRGQRPKRLPRGHKVLRFRAVTRECSDWYNGYTYLDTLSQEAVAKFIEVTHEAYRRRYNRLFGKLIPGVFTDEPNYGGDPDQLTWTPKFREVFRRRYGYDLTSHLVELFFDVDGREVTPARHDYHDCRTHLFVDAFARQIGWWCGKHGLLSTGHVLHEDTLSRQASAVGSCMRFYEHMQAPGMDLLTERWRVYDVAKQVSSAARQFGRTWRLTETYGCTGWDFPFLGHKALGDWQAALGINLRCHHLSWYTMLGQTKRDYPASIFYQSPWAEIYPVVEDYFARIGEVMTRGVEVRDLLVIHPIESMWCMVKRGWLAAASTKVYDRMLIDLRDTLLSHAIDFDYGDEEILSRHGTVGRRDGGAVLRVNKATYRAVIVPPLKTMRRSTLELLARFRERGGVVVFAGDPPAYVDAEPSGDAASFAALCERSPAKGAGLVKSVEGAARRIAIEDGNGRPVYSALHLLREDAGAFYLFVCNTGHHRQHFARGHTDDVRVVERRAAYTDVRIRGFAGCRGRPIELDPGTGVVHEADAQRDGDGWVIHTDLPMLASRLFVIPKASAGRRFRKAARWTTVRDQPISAKTWDIRLSEPNVLVLDRPAFRIGGGVRRGAAEVLRVDMAVRDHLDLPRRGGRMRQPWARTDHDGHGCSAEVELTYAFGAEAVPSGELFLAIEQPHRYEIMLNGRRIDTDSLCGWWCDRSLARLPIDAAALRQGHNELCVTCEYDMEHPGLETLYLLGHFGAAVRGRDVRVTTPPTQLRIGDWVTQGLPFYAGVVSYRREVRLQKVKRGERAFVRVQDYRGAAVRVRVGDETAGVIAWPPNEVEITRFTHGKPIELCIDVFGHRRNSHGPLHHREKWPTWTGPDQFVTSDRDWVDGYQLVPCGLMAPPRLIARSRA